MNKYQTVLTKFIEDGHRLTHRERHEFGAILQELVDKETPIFENSCNAIFDENLLYEAIEWKCQNLNKYCYKKYKV